MKKLLIWINVFLLIILIALYFIGRSPGKPLINEELGLSGTDTKLQALIEAQVGESAKQDNIILPTAKPSALNKLPEVRVQEEQPKVQEYLPAEDFLPLKDTNGRPIMLYYPTGFLPNQVEIKAGNSVKIINVSNGALWLMTSGKPGALDFLPELNSERSLWRGEEFIFTFTKTGEWGVINMNHKEHLAKIVVQPQ
jgi:hypothetical protein